jgi:hypothetical protein
MRPRPRLTRKGHGQAPHHAGDHDAGDGAARGVDEGVDGVWMGWGQGMDGSVAVSVRSMVITSDAGDNAARAREARAGGAGGLGLSPARKARAGAPLGCGGALRRQGRAGARLRPSASARARAHASHPSLPAGTRPQSRRHGRVCGFWGFWDIRVKNISL